MSSYIQIVSMRTWGELGNLLAGRRLARVLSEELPSARIDVVEGDGIVPGLAAIGEEIRMVTLHVEDRSLRTARYLELMARAGERFLSGLEEGATAPESELWRLVEHFGRTRPDLVIATKGIISQLCVAAARHAGIAIPVLNYITNHGLLRLSVHRCRGAGMTMVPFEEAKNFLVKEHNFPPERVTVVGPMVGEHDAGGLPIRSTRASHPAWEIPAEPSKPEDGVPAAPSSKPFIAVLCNRGGAEYCDLLQSLVPRRDEVAVAVVAVGVPEFLAKLRDIHRAANATDWHVHEGLPQGEYLRYLHRMSAADHAVLVSKTGPNTMLEAVYYGVPVLMLESGLPMEAWVGPLAERAGVGRAFSDGHSLIAEVHRWLDAPELFRQHKQRALAFKAAHFDKAETRRRIKATVESALRSGAD